MSLICIFVSVIAFRTLFHVVGVVRIKLGPVPYRFASKFFNGRKERCPTPSAVAWTRRRRAIPRAKRITRISYGPSSLVVVSICCHGIRSEKYYE